MCPRDCVPCPPNDLAAVLVGTEQGHEFADQEGSLGWRARLDRGFHVEGLEAQDEVCRAEVEIGQRTCPVTRDVDVQRASGLDCARKWG